MHAEPEGTFFAQGLIAHQREPSALKGCAARLRDWGQIPKMPQEKVEGGKLAFGQSPMMLPAKESGLPYNF